MTTPADTKRTNRAAALIGPLLGFVIGYGLPDLITWLIG